MGVVGARPGRVVSPEYDLSDPDAVAFCPSCGSGYTARVTRCQPCDAALVPRREVERAAAEAEADEVEEDEEEEAAGLDPGEFAGETEATAPLCRMEDHVLAEELRRDLKAAGVPVWLKFDRWGSLGGAPPFVEFRVPARYLDAARGVLHRVQTDTQGEDPECRPPAAP